MGSKQMPEKNYLFLRGIGKILPLCRRGLSSPLWLVSGCPSTLQIIGTLCGTEQEVSLLHITVLRKQRNR